MQRMNNIHTIVLFVLRCDYYVPACSTAFFTANDSIEIEIVCNGKRGSLTNSISGIEILWSITWKSTVVMLETSLLAKHRQMKTTDFKWTFEKVQGTIDLWDKPRWETVTSGELVRKVWTQTYAPSTILQQFPNMTVGSSPARCCARYPRQHRHSFHHHCYFDKPFQKWEHLFRLCASESRWIVPWSEDNIHHCSNMPTCTWIWKELCGMVSVQHKSILVRNKHEYAHP